MSGCDERLVVPVGALTEWVGPRAWRLPRRSAARLGEGVAHAHRPPVLRGVEVRVESVSGGCARGHGDEPLCGTHCSAGASAASRARHSSRVRRRSI